ncbi:MAG: aminopeptidase [Bacteroidales bacterium]|jgi:bleomycin hydrolase|nr:aminopeptidase [Bacteroidales bacterium]
MKRLVYLLLFALVFSNVSMAQNEKKEEKKGYQFTKVKENPVTPVGDQYRSGTCWSFSAVGLVEAELVRTGKGQYNLSEMWIVRHAYMEKAEHYIRMHGNATFAAGGAFQDIPLMIKKYGIVPEEAYAGLNYGESKHNHSELDAVLEGFVKPLAQAKKLSPSWKTAFNAILDAYFGPVPEKFKYNGKEYTPASFAASLGLNWDDYIEIGSFTHHPFYEKFILEIPDNWTNGEIYNVKLDEMIQIMDDAINNGYCIGWGADVSEKGFSWKNGVAIVPDEDKTDLSGTERDRWEKLTAAEKTAAAYSFDGTAKEKTITQAMRQEGFDNFETTDDHGMVITGIYKDQNGNKFYKVKNSWNTENIYDGYFYASEAFVRFKTMDFQINKNALSPAMKSKLGVK